MKLPEKAPNWLEIVSNNYKSIFSPTTLKMLNELSSSVDLRDEYLYWDKFKYLDIPEGISSELAWAYLKLSRQTKIQKTTLISKDSENFGYWTPDTILRDLSFIDKYSSGLILSDSSGYKSEQKKYIVNSLMEEAIASSQLEGAATTRKVAKEMLRSGRKPRNHAEQMISNNFRTILKIKDLIGVPLNDKILLELHRSMTVDTLENPDWCGRFRNEQDEPISVADRDGETLYIPPPPEKMPAMMNILYEYSNENDDNKKFTHPVVKAVLLHFYLSYIHPFNDGNGRTARALFYWYMLNKGYWMFESLTISRIFIKAPAQYARAFLYTEIDELDLTYFISFNIKVIKIAIQKLIEYIKSKQKELKDITHHLQKYPELNQRQRELLKHSLDNPEAQYTLQEHKTINNITYETARRDLLYLAQKKLLIKTKRGKKFYFMTSQDLSSKIKLK